MIAITVVKDFMLRDITIHNYRCFKDFHIDGLAQVNLIVGMNNSGKTNLLEAAYLLVSQGNILDLFDVLINRGEIINPLERFAKNQALKLDLDRVRHIFYDRNIIRNEVINIQSTQDNQLLFKAEPEFVVDPVHPFENIKIIFSYKPDIPFGFTLDTDGLIRRHFLDPQQANQDLAITSTYKSILLGTTNLKFEQLDLLWSQITLTPKEESVIKSLQILEPQIEGINFIRDETSHSSIILKVRGSRNPIPLVSMGEGMRRILNLAMAAVTVENGFLLVDEIETGLYHQTQTDMWRLILEVAQQLNIQVFATTHSWDCVCAFQEALDELEDKSIGKLFRLSQKGDTIRPVEYTPDELSVAVRQSIEVR